MLDQWLECQDDSCSYVFNLINVTENMSPDDGIRDYLSESFLSAYRDKDFLKFTYQKKPQKELKDYLKNYVLSSDENQITKNVHQGDFGEILASLIVSYFQGLAVPINKLRWKFNSDRSLFCTDMIAHNPEDEIANIYYYEIKTRLNIGRTRPYKKAPLAHVTVNAHNGLLKDELSPNEGIADYLSRLYYDKEDYVKAKKYSDIVSNPDKYNRNFELFFVIEKSKFDDIILTDLNELPPSLTPLRVTIVLIDQLGRLIVDMRDRSIASAIKYVYGEDA